MLPYFSLNRRHRPGDAPMSVRDVGGALAVLKRRVLPALRFRPPRLAGGLRRPDTVSVVVDATAGAVL